MAYHLVMFTARGSRNRKKRSKNRKSVCKHSLVAGMRSARRTLAGQMPRCATCTRKQTRLAPLPFSTAASCPAHQALWGTGAGWGTPCAQAQRCAAPLGPLQGDRHSSRQIMQALRTGYAQAGSLERAVESSRHPGTNGQPKQAAEAGPGSQGTSEQPEQ